MKRAYLKIKKGDMVVVRTGSDRKKSGKVIAVDAEKNRLQIDGIGQGTKHNKPRSLQQGGSLEKFNRWIDASNVGIEHPTKKSSTSRIGYVLNDTNEKKRVYRQADNKEIK